MPPPVPGRRVFLRARFTRWAIPRGRLFPAWVLRVGLFVACLLPASPAPGWGDGGHRLVNRLAAELTAYPANRLFGPNGDFLADHASDPDEWKAVDPDEGRRQYMDIDKLESPPFDRLPVRWEDAVERYGLEKLRSLIDKEFAE